MKEIGLPNGVVALVDDEDYEWLSSMSWHLNSYGYAARKVGRTGTVLMHRMILGLTEGDDRMGDHINGTRLDNRRANLRACTHTENNRNRRRQSNNTTGYKGVSRCKNGRFKAQIKVSGKKITIGYYAAPEDAHKAYCEYATVHHGAFFRPD